MSPESFDLLLTCMYCQATKLAPSPPWRAITIQPTKAEITLLHAFAKSPPARAWCCSACNRRPRCFYESGACTGPVNTIVHDKRCCVRVCMLHALWRLTTSRLIGHGTDCRDKTPGFFS